MEWFNKLPRLVQIILLLIPGVNWVVEVIVRWGCFIQKGGIVHLIVAIVVTIFGCVFGWVDLVWCLIFKHLLLAK